MCAKLCFYDFTQNDLFYMFINLLVDPHNSVCVFDLKPHLSVKHFGQH